MKCGKCDGKLEWVETGKRLFLDVEVESEGYYWCPRCDKPKQKRQKRRGKRGTR